MNTIAWCIEGPSGSKDVYALFGATVLWATRSPSGSPDKVWQYAPMEGRDRAIQHLVEVTGHLEERDWHLVGEPVEFDLSFVAAVTIHGTNCGVWIYAPRLREELLAAVAFSRWEPPPGIPMVTQAEWAKSLKYTEWPTSWLRTWDGKFQ